MRPNLDSLNEEILHYLEAEHFVVFRSLSRMVDEEQMVHWDAEKQPDYKQFLDCALQLGVRLIHFHSREFTPGHREETMERLETVELTREEKRELQRRVEELTIYEGLTCAVEMSFDFENRVYFFEVRTDWYEEWHDIMDELDFSTGPGGEGEGGFGYFSNN